MGLETKHIISDERHYGAFQCAICQNLCGLDAIVTTPCSHVFCRVCIEKWISNGPRCSNVANSQSYRWEGKLDAKCPTCNHNLDFQSRNENTVQQQLSSKEVLMIRGCSIDARKLEYAQPLAYRVLRRIQVCCPLLEKHGCTWRGDYEDLTDHLVSANCSCSSPNDNSQMNQQSGRNSFNSGNQYLDNARNEEKKEHSSSHERSKIHDLAESFKAQADGKFSSANFIEARNLYTKAISVLQNDGDGRAPLNSPIDPNRFSHGDKQILSTLYANRAATYVKLKEHRLCIADCQSCVTIDKFYVKAYNRMYKAHIELGNFTEAHQILYNAYYDHNPNSKVLKAQLANAQHIKTQYERGRQQLQNSDYATASATFGSLLRYSNASVIILGSARADLCLGDVEKALRLSLQVLRSDTQNAEGYAVRGQSMFLAGEDFESSCKLLRESLRLDPDHKEAKSALKRCRKVEQFLKDARTAVFHRRFDDAVKLFTNALEESSPLPMKAPLYSILHAERGQAHLRLNDYLSALEDSANAIRSREDYVAAWLVKMKAYHALGRHEEAKRELDDLMNRWGSGNDQIRRARDDANFQLRRSKRPDFYKLFGVSQLATTIEIKKKYKVKAREYHPDKFSGPKYTDEDRKNAAEKFKLLGAGLEILCDDFKRKLFDDGYDQETIREKVAMAERAANRQHNFR